MFVKLKNSKNLIEPLIAKNLNFTSQLSKNTGNFIKNQFIFDYFLYYKVFFLLNNREINDVFKDTFSKVFLNKKIDNTLFSKIIDKNGLIAYEKTYEISSNDIVQGLPKLNSVLESSFEAKNIEYSASGLTVPLNKTQNICITPYDIKFNFFPGLTRIIEKKHKTRENKDPENFSWFLLLTKDKFCLEKTIFYNKLKIKSFVANSLQRIYREQNITISKKIFESVINVMFSRILIIQPLYNPFSYNETINIKIYLKLIKVAMKLKTLPPIGLPIVDGISKSLKGSDRMLSSISFKDTINDLTNRVIFNSKDWLISAKANLIISQKLKTGSNINNKTDIYLSIKDLLLKNSYSSLYEM